MFTVANAQDKTVRFSLSATVQKQPAMGKPKVSILHLFGNDN
jgi:hypothetical protein